MNRTNMIPLPARMRWQFTIGVFLCTLAFYHFLCSYYAEAVEIYTLYHDYYEYEPHTTPQPPIQYTDYQDLYPNTSVRAKLLRIEQTNLCIVFVHVEVWSFVRV